LLPLAGALAAEPGVNLLRPNSLPGWEYGGAPRGWKIASGMLQGGAKSSALLSGWTVGDFTLSLHWWAADRAALVVNFPDVPTGAGLSVSLAAGSPSVAITDLGKNVFSGGKIAPTANAWHTTRLTRAADKLSIDVDGKPLGEVKLDASRRFGLGLAVRGGEVAVTDLRLAEPAGESIFNGKDLDGWWSPLGLGSWQAHDGAIECLNKDGNYLRSEKEFGNFTLSLQYKQSPHCNSGIGIRTPRNGWPSGDGMELQLQDEPGLDKQSTMAIYGNLEPLARADRSEGWNSVVIKADGRMISGWVNGELVQQTNTFRHPELKHRHLKGWIGFQDHGGQIEFRNIRVLAAPDGPGLSAWYAPRAQTGPELLFARLLNPERLSIPDGIVSAVVERKMPSGEEQVLAELTGPGAVTQVWRSKPSGHIAFYFDGQKQPAIDCLANLLHTHTPHLAEESDPVLTCLPFAKSLRITLREAPGAVYRIEYSKFPAGTPVETYEQGKPILPRGWLSAIDYRQHQYGWGTHREEDPAPRHAGAVDKLDPGQSAKLVDVDGAGIAQWFKLQANSSMIGNDDLWLEVRIGGESEPAVAAPARYFFPALSSHVPLVGTPSNHYNFASVFRDGFTSMLAMPFDGGLTITARNAGQTALGKMTIVTSVLRDDGTDLATPRLNINKRMRLRGQFFPASDSHELVSLSGEGRLVGLVWAPNEKSPGAIASLAVDGRQQLGWNHDGLDSFLGGVPGEKSFFRVLSGRHDHLAWRYLLLSPVDFRSSLLLTSTSTVGERLVLWYQR
jgi:hypothetical protein